MQGTRNLFLETAREKNSYPEAAAELGIRIFAGHSCTS